MIIYSNLTLRERANVNNDCQNFSTNNINGSQDNNDCLQGVTHQVGAIRVVHAVGWKGGGRGESGVSGGHVELSVGFRGRCRTVSVALFAEALRIAGDVTRRRLDVGEESVCKQHTTVDKCHTHRTRWQ